MRYVVGILEVGYDEIAMEHVTVLDERFDGTPTHIAKNAILQHEEAMCHFSEEEFEEFRSWIQQNAEQAKSFSEFRNILFTHNADFPCYYISDPIQV